MNNSKSRIESILSFWFGDVTRDTATKQIHLTKSLQNKWFPHTKQQRTSIDSYIVHHFREDIQNLFDGKYKDWENDDRGLLACIILADQLSRNAFRGTPDAFKFDFIALRLANVVLRKYHVVTGTTMEKSSYELYRSAFRPEERLFISMPFEHSESMQDQYTDLMLKDEVMGDPDVVAFEGNKQTFAMFTQYSEAHCKVIERFGRYPHRNAILNRESTPEEVNWLASDEAVSF